MRRVDRPSRAIAGLPMAAAVIAVLVATSMLVARPSQAQAGTTDPLLDFLRTAAAARGKVVVIDGVRVPLTDPANDQSTSSGQPPVIALPQNDIVLEDHLLLGSLTGELLENPFTCANPGANLCSEFGSEPTAFGQGALLLFQGLAGDPRERDPGLRYEWAILGRDPDFPPPPAVAERPSDPFAGAVSHIWLIRLQGDQVALSLLIYSNGRFDVYRTHARAMLTATGIFWLVPMDAEWDQISDFDLYAFAGDDSTSGFDSLRTFPDQSGAMLSFEPGPLVAFSDAPASSATTTATPTTAPTTAPTRAPPPTPTASDATPTATPAASGDGTPTSGTGDVEWLVLIALGLVVLVVLAIAAWLLFGPGRKPPGAPASGCRDGDEEWRNDGQPGEFLVPDPLGRVRIVAEPVAPELEAWLDGFGQPRGAPLADFTRVDGRERNRLLTGLPTTPTRLDGRIVIPLLLRRLQCQRRWICDGGAWVPTPDHRTMEGAPTPTSRSYRFDGPVRTVDDVHRAWQEAVEALEAAEAQVSDAERYRAACA